MSPPSPWWNPIRHADRRPALLARAAIKRAIRAWFESQGFIEVEPGCLQVSPGNETHLHAFRTERIGTDLTRHDLYLHTSPEFAMKKLLAAGEQKIFSFAPVFRNREAGPLHASEFTMLEWYRAGAPYEALFEDCAAIVRIAAETTQRHDWSYRGKRCDVFETPARLTLVEAFAEFAGIALGDVAPDGGNGRTAFAERASAERIRITDDDTWSDIFSKVLTEKIEPKLGIARPLFLYEYPISEAALARPTVERPQFAERFELYICGIELANGFGELTDPNVQRQRFEKWMDDKERIYAERYPIDEDFLGALANMPAASGCALGFDRLIMLATGAERLDHVIWTPLHER